MQTGLLAVIDALRQKVDRVMLFGHNPEFTDLAHRLSSDIADMPTCAIAEFRFDTKTWVGCRQRGTRGVDAR